MSEDGLKEIDWHLSEANTAVELIRLAETGVELRRSWESFLSCFSRSIGRLITLSKSDSRSKPWGHRLLAASKKDDEGLVLLREARNSSEHGLSPSAGFVDPMVAIGRGAIGLSGNVNMRFGRLVVDGSEPHDLSISIRDGRIAKLEGPVNTDVFEIPAMVEMRRLHSEEKSRWFEIPTKVWDQPVTFGCAQSLTNRAIVGLRDSRLDLGRLFQSTMR